MSRAELDSIQNLLPLRRNDFKAFVVIYNLAEPLGKYRGMLRTSRKALAEKLDVSLPTLDRIIEDLKLCTLIKVLTSKKGRPRGGRGHSRDRGRLVIEIKKYQTAWQAGKEGVENYDPDQEHQI
jgi:hypothetical protein